MLDPRQSYSPPSIVQGEDHDLFFSWKDFCNPCIDFPDLTTATEIDAVFAATISNLPACQHYKLSLSEITVVNSWNGIIHLTAATTPTLVLSPVGPPPVPSSFELRVTIAGKTRYYQSLQSFLVVASLYPIGC